MKTNCISPRTESCVRALLLPVCCACIQTHGNESEANSLASLQSRAAKGDAGAQYNLGVRYNGSNGVEKNVVEAVKWWRKAARQNCAEAQYILATCLAESYWHKFGQDAATE